jgi:hypothetical protein
MRIHLAIVIISIIVDFTMTGLTTTDVIWILLGDTVVLLLPLADIIWILHEDLLLLLIIITPWNPHEDTIWIIDISKEVRGLQQHLRLLQDPWTDVTILCDHYLCIIYSNKLPNYEFSYEYLLNYFYEKE